MDHGGLPGSVVLDEPSLGLSSVLVTEIFRFPLSALGDLQVWLELTDQVNSTPRKGFAV
jgi:ABC-type branched-subunit amino acid transport system ATPase component